MDIESARAVLIDHARHPRNAEGGDLHSLKGECRNPLCGDFVRVFVSLEDSRVSSVSMDLQGCTICTASASLMSENIRGLTVEEIDELRQTFSDILVTAVHVDWPEQLRAFGAFSHLRVNPARVPCALIPWYALKEALQTKI